MHINQEIRSTRSKSNERYLIVAVSLDGLQLALTNLVHSAPKKPISIAKDKVYKNIREKEWEVVDHDFPEFLFKPDSELEDKWKTARDDARSAISSLIDDQNTLDEYLFGSPSGILADLIRKSGKSRSFIHNKLARWFSNGGMDNALLPHYVNCGTNHKMLDKPIINDDGTVSLASKPGKPTSYGDSYRSVTLQDLKLIEVFAKKIPTGSKVSLTHLYNQFIVESMSSKWSPKPPSAFEEVNQETIPFPRQYLISPRSFRYFLNSFIDGLTWIKKRVGQISYDRDHKGKPGSAKSGLRYAGQRFEIDATIADVYIKYSYSDEELISCGRPVVYFIIDTYSSMIVGFHIGFEGPNWNGASQALFNAFENKVDFCKRWGIEIKETEWPCDSICSELVWDRGGENSDNNLESVLKGRIGIKIMKLVAYHRGDCKGTVEKTFDTVLSKVLVFDPGRVLKYPSKEIQHPSRKPFLEYEDFVRKIIKIIINKNNYSRKEAHNFHMESIKVGYTPRDIWNHFSDNIIQKPNISKDRIRFALMPEAEATVTDKGVKFRGLYFSSQDIQKMLWLDKAKNFGRYKIKIRYSDATTNHVWHYNEETKQLMQLDLQDRCEAYKNQIWANVLHRLEIRKHELAAQDEFRFNKNILLDMDLSDMDEAIKKRNKRLKKSEAKNSETGTKMRKDIAASVNRNRQKDDVVEDMTPSISQPETATDNTENCSDQDLSDPTFIY